ISGYVQVAAGAAYGDTTFSLTYFASDDNGANWTTGVDLFPSMHSDVRSLSCFTISEDGYPYAIATWRTASTRGTFFVSDPSGPNAGGWTSPVQIGDTTQWPITNYGTITVNPEGNQIAFIGWNDYASYGGNTSSDYGVTWNTYSALPQLNPDSNAAIYRTDIGTIRWGNGNNVFGLIGITPTADSMAYIAGRGTTFGFIQSGDGGATYSALQPVFNGEWWPSIDGMGTDSFTYTLDTVDNEYAGDAFEVQAWYDPAQGIFVDELGRIDGKSIAPGTWWHKWDMEIVGDTLYVIAPFQMVTVDYVTEGDLYTFIDYWDNMMYGYMEIPEDTTDTSGIVEMASSSPDFHWMYLDVNCNVIDTLGNLDTYRGFQGSAQLCYDWRYDDMYVVYMDFYDTATGVGSHELIKIPQGSNYSARAVTPPLLNSNVFNAIQAAKLIDENGVIHQIWRPDDADSIYYAGIDVDDVERWEWTGPVGQYKPKKENITSPPFYSINRIYHEKDDISFILSSDTYITVKLYDVTGREQMIICSREFQSGNYHIPLNMETMPAGMYYAVIMKDNERYRERIIVLK
ncbi:MAG: hypothetical protein SVK54_06720, partial [candidate division WOR-3 bacterium]|nr:hypothetical protein [candidate division WOR-3 bacterium]